MSSVSALSFNRALVTGASGFVGRHLVRRLADDGCFVVGVDLSTSWNPQICGVEFVTADIRDPNVVQTALSKAQPEVVFHLAAQPSPAQSMRDPVADIQLNVLGSVNVARAAVSIGVRRFVFFSTGGAMYGGGAIGGEHERMLVDDNTPPAPDSVYGASKLAVEHYLRVLCQDAEMQTSVLRPGHVYGPSPRQSLNGEYEEIAANFAYRMIRDEPIRIVGDGNQQLDYVYVDDVVEATLKAATLEPATCVIGTGVAPRTLEVFEIVARLTDYAREPVFLGRTTYSYVMDTQRARSTWTWEPQVSLEDGIAATVEWFRSELRVT